jgi:hypothetical protein
MTPGFQQYAPVMPILVLGKGDVDTHLPNAIAGDRQ